MRIHTFGYDSDWTKSQQSTLTIHDFGQALLADLYNAPGLRRNGNVSSLVDRNLLGQGLGISSGREADLFVSGAGRRQLYWWRTAWGDWW